jgi:hypothetical protein
LAGAGGGILPVLVILRDFAHSLPAAPPFPAEPHHLWDFITRRLTAQNLDFVSEPLRHALDEGQVLLLLDGLDEVAGQASRRFVRDAVHTFMTRYPDNRYLITCRILSYQPPASPNRPDLRLPPTIPALE